MQCSASRTKFLLTKIMHRVRVFTPQKLPAMYGTMCLCISIAQHEGGLRFLPRITHTLT